MTPLLDNLLAWFIQLCAVSLLGTVLPLVFTIRHPRTQLTFGYAVLAACLLLPFVQPYRQTPASTQAPATVVPTLTSTATSVASEAGGDLESLAPETAAAQPPASVAGQPALTRSASSGATWWPAWTIREWLLVIFAAGAWVRLCRLALGAWQIRRYRLAATPFYPVPESVLRAGERVGARALVCLSRDVSSPATLGLFRPVILMPASFLTLDPAAQEAVACHELLHVRRRDWGLAMVEGVISAVLWFTPVTWLISEIRLSREQVVDEEVVSLTAEKDSYIQALLDIARARPTLDIVPAPMFIRRRHLTHRVQALLDGASDSLRRLSVCYATMSALLAAGGWIAVVLFPLAAMPRAADAAIVRLEPAQETARPEVTPVSTRPASPTAPAMAAAAATATVSTPEADEWAEPIVGPIVTASSPGERAAALALLEQAKQNSDLHIPGTPSFHIEAAFDASGAVADAGNGEISETWMSGQRWRWTATLGGYSQIRIGSGQTGFDVEPGRTLLPMRVHMLRRAVFAPVRVTNGSRVRVAAARVNGTPVTCVLLGPSPGPESPVRFWQEDEYCVDAAGLLRVHSPALGAYTRFDYRRPLRFGGRVLPGELRTYIGGVEVMRARLTIRSAADADDSLFTATQEMVARGAGPPTNVGKAWLRAPAADAATAPEIVVVHAAVDPSGAVLEAEVASGDPRLADAALEIVRTRRFAAAAAQRDFYVGVNFGGDYAIP